MKEIDIEQITLNNPYLRTNTDIESLKKSIETLGLINPITINKDFQLLAGSRRYLAMKELGFTKVPVLIMDRSIDEQELISIDENLVRKGLDKLEFETCLNRGREIYEKLNPSANKIDISNKDLTPDEVKKEKEAEELDSSSFAAITAQKTGLSKQVIKGAIKRDALSSENIKKARSLGEISASQVNEIIKLEKKDQDKILDYVKDKSVKDVRKLISSARTSGIDKAIDDSLNLEVLPPEFNKANLMAKKVNKLLSQILLENIDCQSEEIKKIVKTMSLLMQNSTEFLRKYDETQSFIPKVAKDFNEDRIQ